MHDRDLEMAVSLSKSRYSSTRAAKEVSEKREYCFLCSLLFKVLYRLPLVIFLLVLLFLWSTSTTIISGKIVHVCVSSRKLNNLYCLSAGAQSQLSFELPGVPIFRNISGGLSNEEDIPEEITNAVQESPIPVKKVFRVPSIDRNSSKATSTSVQESTIPVPVIVSGVKNQSDEEIAEAMNAVKDQLEVHRSWVSSGGHLKCEGRGIYVYDLPSKFNKDLMSRCSDMVPWINFCKYFKNDAMGDPVPKLGDHWYWTHQYSLEPIFHSRILKHPCRYSWQTL